MIRRREVLVLATAAVSLAAARANARPSASAYGQDDIALGRAHAPATLIEYASITCPHCREFHEQVWAPLKLNYIDRGRLRFIFREFPTAGPAVAVAGFQVARCGGVTPNVYMTRVSSFFAHQDVVDEPMFRSDMNAVREGLVSWGASAGLNEQQVMTCITDPAGADRARRLMTQGQQDFGVSGTPTLILNGRKLDQQADPSVLTYEGLARLIDAAIAGH